MSKPMAERMAAARAAADAREAARDAKHAARRTKRLSKNVVESVTISPERVAVEEQVIQAQAEIEAKALVPASKPNCIDRSTPRNAQGMRISEASREFARQKRDRANALIAKTLDVCESGDLSESADDNNFTKLTKAVMRNATNAGEDNLNGAVKALATVAEITGMLDKQQEAQPNAVAQVVINMPVLMHQEIIREEDTSFSPNANLKRPSWANDVLPVVDAEVLNNDPPDTYRRKA